MRFQPTSSRLCATLIAALFIACAVAATTAFAQSTTVTTNETVPLNGSIINPCNAEVVALQGNVHITNHMTTDASGGTHLKTHLNFQDVSGTGATTGLNYTVRTTTNETVNDNDGPQYEATIISTVKLISQGSTLNSFLQTVFHVTINANGVTTTTVDETRMECRGSN
ncbi:MAG TPA: hypothetical protein VFZ44_06455 [Pyrinomonadaceae bacterium]